MPADVTACSRTTGTTGPQSSVQGPRSAPGPRSLVRWTPPGTGPGTSDPGLRNQKACNFDQGGAVEHPDREFKGEGTRVWNAGSPNESPDRSSSGVAAQFRIKARAERGLAGQTRRVAALFSDG